MNRDSLATKASDYLAAIWNSSGAVGWYCCFVVVVVVGCVVVVVFNGIIAIMTVTVVIIVNILQIVITMIVATMTALIDYGPTEQPRHRATHTYGVIFSCAWKQAR